MSSFINRIDELVRHLGSSASSVNAKQGDRVYNFHYRPSEWTEFRQSLQQIVSGLRIKDSLHWWLPSLILLGHIQR